MHPCFTVNFWHWTSMLWLIDICQNKVPADQYHVTMLQAQVYSSSRSCFFWSWPLIKCWFSIGLRAHVRLSCWKQSRIVRKAVNANPGLKVNRIITFSSIEMVLCIWWLLKLKTEGQTIYRKPHRKVENLDQNSTFPWVSPGAALLGWPKSIYYFYAVSGVTWYKLLFLRFRNQQYWSQVFT